MSIVEYFQTKHARAIAEKVQSFVVKSNRLALGQHTYFNDEYVTKAIIQMYADFLEASEKHETHADERRAEDLFDYYNYNKTNFEKTFEQHCFEYIKVKKIKGLTEEQHGLIDGAHAAVDQKYKTYVASMVARPSKENDSVKVK